MKVIIIRIIKNNTNYEQLSIPDKSLSATTKAKIGDQYTKDINRDPWVIIIN